MRWAALIAVIAGCGSEGGGQQNPCANIDSTPIGCGDNASFEVMYGGDEAALADAVVSVCRNEVCVEGPLPAVPETMEWHYGTYLSGAFSARVALYRRAQILVEVGTMDDSAQLSDGDVYTLTITSQGNVLSQSRWTARYTEVSAASACSAGCSHAELEPLL